MNVLPTILLIFQIVAASEAFKILTIFGFCAHSHNSLGYRFATQLADRGHQVTFISCIPKDKPYKNIKEISVAEIAPEIGRSVANLEEFGAMSYLGQLDWIHNVGVIYTTEFFKVKAIQDLLKSNEEFDIILMEQFLNDAFTYFHHRFKAPLVMFAPGPSSFFNNHLTGNSAPPSFVPNLVSEYDSKMTFWQRLVNTYRHVASELYVHFKIVPDHNKILKKYFPDAPDLSTFLYNASLLLVSSHYSLSDPVPLQQNVKAVGGYHVFPPKSLPDDLKKYLDDAKEGVVLFSMGSNLRSSDLDTEVRKAILNAFSKIKQKVLWKFEADLPEKPKNVMIKKWLPQQDILAHPNVVLFISHGGLLGTTEALYHGVPILGLPVFWDQTKNIEEAARKGFAIRLNFRQLNEERFTHALTELLENPSYRRLAKEQANIMHDVPISQIDESMFWIEYVARHKGAVHLKSIATDLPWYQYYLVDIALFVVTVLVIFVIVIVLLIKIVAKSLFSKSKKDKLKKN